MTTMPLWTMREILGALGSGEEIRDDVPVQDVRIYARHIAADWVFLPRNEAVNSVGSAKIALRRGAVGAVISKPYDGPLPIYTVGANPLSNLHRLASAARSRLDGRVVAVTGSVGKTSTTQMALSVLSKFGRSYGTSQNMNIDRQTLIQMINAPRDTDYCVFEAAAGISGLAPRSRALKPDVAVVTKIGYSHLEMHGSRGRLAQRKFSLADHLDNGGYVVCDKEGLDFAVTSGSRSAVRIVDKAITAGAGGDITYDDIDVGADTVRARLSFRGSSFRLLMKEALPYHIHSAALVLGTGAALGLNLDDVVDAINEYVPSIARRMQRHEIVSTDGGRAMLIDDAYNASIESFTVAISHVQRQQNQRKILVFGDILELGAAAEQIHDTLIPLIEAAGFDLIYAVGDHARRIGAKLNSCPVVSCRTIEQAAPLVLSSVRDGDIVLLKASKGVRLKVIADLAQTAG